MTRPAFAIVRLTRTATLALVLAASTFTGTAFADDEYGTNHEMVIRQAAASTATNVLSSVASTTGVTSGGYDIVGAGGPQDVLARQIYHPGSGTDW